MSWAQDIKVIIYLVIQIFIVFPYNALTIPRQRQLRKNQITSKDIGAEPAAMISDKVYKLCTSKESVSTLLAADPTLAPEDAWKKLYGGHAAGEKQSKETARARRDQATPDDLKRAFECGNWGPTRPSELFLQVRMNILQFLFSPNTRRCTTMLFAPSTTMWLQVWLARH